MKYYKCDICGYEHEGNEPPKYCIVCKAPENHFFEYDKDNVIKQQHHQLNKTIQENKYKGIPTCPKCGSISIEAVNRGFSLLTGFVGSGKIENCGYV